MANDIERSEEVILWISARGTIQVSDAIRGGRHRFV